MTRHKTGTREEWLTARRELLKAEKELTRRSDERARRRQELPWVRIAKDYRFETDEGSAALAHLFRGRSQLLNYRKSGVTSRKDAVAESEAAPDSGAAKLAAGGGVEWATFIREAPGMSAFALEDGVVYHTYSAYARGLDGL